MISRRGLLKLFGIGIAGLAAAAVYPFAEAFGKPRITRYALTPRRWPAGLNLRICVLSDIHACEPWMSASRVEAICAQAQELQADIILLLGDFLSGMSLVTDQVEVSDWSAAIGRLKAPLGVHAILGNHDYWEDHAFQMDPSRTPLVAEALERNGISVHVNHAIHIEKDGAGFWLAGLGDQRALIGSKVYGRGKLGGLDDLDGTIAQCVGDDPVILMAHEPDIFPSVGERVSLTLCGHTHGGQINVFGWRPASASRGSAIYPAGHFNESGRELIVSRGLGCSILPIRFGSPPEINLIEIG